MTKSLVAIGSIGLGGCVVLSMLMQRALTVQEALSAHPLQTTLVERFSRRLVGPPMVAVEQTDRGERLSVRLCVLAGLRKARIVEAVGALAWNQLRGGENVPVEIVVSVTDDGEGRTLTRSFPRPVR